MDNSYTSSPRDILNECLAEYNSLVSCRDTMYDAAALITRAFKDGKKMLVCGNGGSAADSEHIVGELMKSFRFKRGIDPDFTKKYFEINGTKVPNWLEGALPAISLVSQTSLSSAFCNDESAIGVFAQQVYGYGVEGDVLVAISTSGSSVNVLEAVKVARAIGMKVIALTGARQSELSEIADIAICVPEKDTFKIQELHLPVYHCLCAMVEAEIFGV